jgi:hypothetical protein
MVSPPPAWSTSPLDRSPKAGRLECLRPGIRALARAHRVLPTFVHWPDHNDYAERGFRRRYASQFRTRAARDVGPVLDVTVASASWGRSSTPSAPSGASTSTPRMPRPSSPPPSRSSTRWDEEEINHQGHQEHQEKRRERREAHPARHFFVCLVSLVVPLWASRDAQNQASLLVAGFQLQGHGEVVG